MSKYIFIAAFCLGFLSCRKYTLPPCSGNCLEFHVSGDVTLQPVNSGFKGIPVTVELAGTNCLICQEADVAVQNTGADGKFDLSFTIDSTLLTKNKLIVYIPNMAGHISVPYVFDSSKYVSQELSKYDPTFNNSVIHFQFYSKANLSIRLKRTQTDSFAYFGFDHKFANGVEFGDYVTAGNQHLPADTLFNVETATGVYTTVIVTKTTTIGNPVTNYDSIICTSNGPNLVNVNY